MDSLTQAALGASVAHLCWQKNIGKKSLFYGAALGTLQDLDILIYPFLNGVQRLYWHRGVSHSIFFVIIISLLGSIVLRKKARNYDISQLRLFLGLFLVFFTHIIIDYFTIYGTQIFAPFSRYGYGMGNLFIIDPLYTLPLIVGIIACFFVNKKRQIKINILCFTISSSYAIFSLCFNIYADHIFRKDLKLKNISVISSMTSATPMNTILWRHIARTEKGLLIGYFSLIGKIKDDKINFTLVKRNEELIKGMENQANVSAVKWFSKGFWVAEKKGDILTMSDLRFGEFRPYKDSPQYEWKYIFTWQLNKDPNNLIHIKSEIDVKKVFSQVINRIKGLE